MTFVGVSASFAAAPTISNIPDVIIGDAEDNVGSDNNFFVFTNAFSFDAYAADTDTPVASLQWSFDEGDDAVAPNERWFSVNGKQAVHLGAAEIASSGSAGHNPPAPANELRSVSSFATFRDIIFSPPPGSGPFADPAPPADKTDHYNGKVVRFFVSDGTNVASRDLIVMTRDNEFDRLTGGSQLGCINDDPLTSTANWSINQTIPTGAATADFDSVNQAIRARVSSDATRYRVATWLTNNAVLSYGAVSSDKYARAKFYVYRTGQTTPSDTTQIPTLRIKLMQRFVIASMLEVFTHVSGIPSLDGIGADLRPNSDPTSPSIYRVDFDMPEIPQNVNNPSTEGALASFEAYAVSPQDNGYLALTELVAGCYPAVGGTLAKSYTGTDLWVTGQDEATIEKSSILFSATAQPGEYGSGSTTIFPVVTEGASSLTFNSVGTTFQLNGDGTKRVGILEQILDPVLDYAQRVRCEEGKLYKARFHVTSTRASNLQCQMRLIMRTAAFNYNLKYEVGGAYALDGTNPKNLAWQQLPGVGNLNPDKLVPGENGCWYTVLLSSPLNKDIRPDVPGTIAQRMPNLATLPGTGQNVNSPRRDVKVGMTLIDSISSTSNQNLEGGDFVFDRVDLFVADEIVE